MVTFFFCIKHVIFGAGACLAPGSYFEKKNTLGRGLLGDAIPITKALCLVVSDKKIFKVSVRAHLT